MTSPSALVKLRRNWFALLLVHLNVMFVALALFLVIGGLASGRAVPLGVGVVVAGLALSPTLLGAYISEGTLHCGYRWNRFAIPLDTVEVIYIGTVQRFGLRGGDANGLRLGLNSGNSFIVRESQFCTTKRLAEWAMSISQSGASPRIVHSTSTL